MNTESSVAESLSKFLERLDPVFVPWGFTFQRDDVGFGHGGYYASGHYCRSTTRIGLSCRNTIDNIYYQHSFVTERYGVREIEKFDIGHELLMRGLGHASDCWLKHSPMSSGQLVTDGGIDIVDAWIHDLQSIAAPALCEPNETFLAIIRNGWRRFNVEYVG